MANANPVRGGRGFLTDEELKQACREANIHDFIIGLPTIMAADEILVMKDGAIVERGTHKDLVMCDGVYQELYRTQFRYSTIEP